jgi:hypothetical protein
MAILTAGKRARRHSPQSATTCLSTQALMSGMRPADSRTGRNAPGASNPCSGSRAHGTIPSGHHLHGYRFVGRRLTRGYTATSLEPGYLQAFPTISIELPLMLVGRVRHQGYDNERPPSRRLATAVECFIQRRSHLGASQILAQEVDSLSIEYAAGHCRADCRTPRGAGSLFIGRRTIVSVNSFWTTPGTEVNSNPWIERLRAMPPNCLRAALADQVPSRHQSISLPMTHVRTVPPTHIWEPSCSM